MVSPEEQDLCSRLQSVGGAATLTTSLPASRTIHGSQCCLFNPPSLPHLPPDLSFRSPDHPWSPIHHTAFMLPTFTLLTPLQECPTPTPTSETQVPFKAQLKGVTSSRRPSLIPFAAVPPPFPENSADVPPTELVLVSPLRPQAT